MKKLSGLACVVVLTVGTGCGVGYPVGSVYNGTTTPHGMSKNETAATFQGQMKPGPKNGEACATGILGLAAWGDASLGAAKKAGAITDVHSVEFRGYNILGVYTQGCTVVNGN
jgi:hypothetical protein